MLSSEDLDELDRRVIRMLETGDCGGLERIGSGVITCVLAWRGYACKRLPPFGGPEPLIAYRALLNGYLEALERAGVVTLDTSLVALNRVGDPVAYLVQPRIPAAQVLPAWIRDVEPDRGMAVVLRVLDLTSACLDAGVGIDATLQNWFVSEGHPIYLDVSTPMLRDERGRDRLDPELFLTPLPLLVRGMIRRFLVPQLLARHFSPRTVFLNLVGDLENCRLVERTDAILDAVNQRLDEPISRAEVYRHRHSERVLWSAVDLLREVEDRWSRHVLRTPSAHLHPAAFDHERST